MVNIQLLPHQTEAAEHVIDDLENNARSLLIMTMGSGKTYVALSVLDYFFYFDAKTQGLILSHRTAILEQWKAKISEVFQQEVNTISTEGELRGNGKFCTCSFQRARALLKRGKLPTSSFHYVVVDEAHHAQAPTYKNVLNQLQYDWILGLTATPDRLDGADIRTIFGEESFTYDLVQALEDGVLPPATLKIRSCQIDEEGLERLRQDAQEERITQKELERRIFVNSKISDECRMIQEKCDNEQALIFCTSIAHAEEVASRLPNASVMHSRNSDAVNNGILRQFKNGEIQYLISIDMLFEGLTLPFVKYAVSLRSTESSTVIWQTIGRPLHPHPDKDHVVFIDCVGNLKKLEELSELQREIQTRRTEVASNSSSQKPVFHVDTPIQFEWANEIGDLYDLIQRISPEEKYSTLTECQEAWADLVKKYDLDNTRRSYHKNYSLDPKLPSWKAIKNQFNISWSQFLGKEYYSTLEEIQEAWADLVRKYGLKNTLESYKENRHLDPKLPGWYAIKNRFHISSWKEFNSELGNDQYSTLPECQDAWSYLVNKHVLKNTVDSYKDNHSLDPKLPSWETIKNRFHISSWEEFKPKLGDEKYSTFEEIQEAWADLVKKYDLDNTRRSYHKNRSLDPKLPSWKAIQNWFNISFWKEFKPKLEDEKYSTLKEIQEAWTDLVRKYDLKNTFESYKKNRHLDPKLPGWKAIKNQFNISWSQFLGKEYYSTLKEIQEAWADLVRKYDLKNTFESYKDNHSLDLKLPSWSSIRNWFNISSWKEFKPDV